MRTIYNLICDNCHNDFTRDSKSMKTGGRKKSNFIFCSKNCYTVFQSFKIDITCSNCNLSFKRINSQIKKSKSGNQFCTKSCAATHNNLNKSYGIRRSKLEKQIETQITSLYTDLDFEFNQKTAIGSELDIFIPKLKLAFELNGIYHYEPIHGTNKLNKTKNNDQLKFALCHQNKISLCVIDISFIKNFKPIKAQRILKIITDIIEDKMAVGVGFEPT